MTIKEIKTIIQYNAKILSIAGELINKTSELSKYLEEQINNVEEND